MPKAPPADFQIHVDPSCLTNTTDSEMSPERTASNETTIHHELEDPVVENATEENIEEHNAEDVETQVQNRSDEARERQIDRIEAQIQAAARAVVASIEEDNYHGEDSVLSMQTDESYDREHTELISGDGTELTYGDGTELTYDGIEGTYETEDEHHGQEEEGDSSSHHDGDIDDDIFTNSDHSKRSSLNSVIEMNSSDETQGKELASPVVGEEAGSQPVSRIPSTSSYIKDESTPITPSRVLSRPPFRTPSSVRAIQMTSPTPSLFSSPRSTKRHLPTVSRIGTPSSPFSKKTPTRFKAKKENPLVLLHVTVLPLSWSYSHVMTAPDLPSALQSVKDNWRLLQGQLGEAVLERGILLPHPQDDYEILEERLLEALELPVRPRAKILKCGHYMGPATPLEDEDRDQFFQVDENKWCDICGKDVKLEGIMDGSMEKRFRVKIYASNGLMRAGAWAACWREMERVDVELQPFVEGALAVELEHFAISVPALASVQSEVDDGFVDEEETLEPPNELDDTEESIKAKLKEEKEMQRVIRKEEKLLRKKIAEEERMREIYGTNTSPAEDQPQSSQRQRSSQRHEESLPDLMIAAFKVAMKDTKNVAIVILSVLVLLLALKPRGVVIADPPTARVPGNANDVMIGKSVEAPKVIDDAFPRAPEAVLAVESSIPPEVVKEEISKSQYIEKSASNGPRKPSGQAPESDDRANPAIEQQIFEKTELQFDVSPGVIPKGAGHSQKLPSTNNQVPSTLEIDAAKLKADHNDPDLKEVVPII